MKRIILKFKSIATAILCGLLLVGCSISKHAGIITVKQPEKSSQNAEAWFLYYQDQLDAYKGSAVYAPDDSYPEEARTGFKRAMLDWNDRKEKATLNSTLLGIGLGIGIPLLFLLF